MTEDENDEGAVEYRAYPKSVQPGIPRLGPLPSSWRRLRLDALVEHVQRPADMRDDCEYQLVTARRNRGGIVARERLAGKDIATKTQFWTHEGDFLISRRQIAHGACGIVPADLHGALVSNEYAVIRPTQELDLGFLQHLSHSIYFQQTCFHSSIGVHVEKLVFKLDNWFRWEFHIPGSDEQRRISEVLDAWDLASRTADKLAKEYANRKRMLQHATFGDVHNPFMVHGRPLGSIAKVEYGKSVRSDAYDDFGPAWVVGTSGVMAKTKIGKPGPAIVVGRKGTLNNPILVPASQLFAAIDTTFVIRTTKNIDTLFYYLEYVDLSKLNEASGVPSVSAEALKSLPIPRLSGSQAAMLRDADDMVAAAEAYAEGLRRQKGGLMQKLLTGDWRVPGRGDSFVPSGSAANLIAEAVA